MRIRPASRRDLPAIAALERSAFGEEAYPVVFLRQALDLWPELLLVAQDDERVVGHALAAPATRPGEAWILGVAVRAEARGRGNGRALTEALLGVLRDRGCDRVHLTVHPDNAAAIRLYVGLGFEVYGEEEAYFGPGEPRVVLSWRKPEV